MPEGVDGVEVRAEERVPTTARKSARPSQAPAWEARRATRARSGRSFVAVVVVLVLFFAVVAATVTRQHLARASSNASAFRGAYLGMTASDLRQRFSPGAKGKWGASTSAVGEEALVWTTDDAAADVVRATFEFHDRILVAVRADLAAAAPEASEPPRTVTPVTVRAVDVAPRPSGQGTAGDSLTILARDCPTHAPEVAHLLANN